MKLSYFTFNLFINQWMVFSCNLEHIHDVPIILCYIFSEWKVLPKQKFIFSQDGDHTLIVPRFFLCMACSSEEVYCCCLTALNILKIMIITNLWFCRLIFYIVIQIVLVFNYTTTMAENNNNRKTLGIVRGLFLVTTTNLSLIN